MEGISVRDRTLYCGYGKDCGTAAILARMLQNRNESQNGNDFGGLQKGKELTLLTCLQSSCGNSRSY